MAKKTYHDYNRKVVYLNFKYSKLFEAYAYDLLGDSSRKTSVTGAKMIKAFLDKIPIYEQNKLIANYDEMIQEKLRNGEFNPVFDEEIISRVKGSLKKNVG